MKTSVPLKAGLIFILINLLLSTSSFSQTLYPFRARLSGDEIWGYHDQNGKVVVKPKYTKAEEFVDGLGRITLLNDDVEWRYGFVDGTGKEIIPLVYSQVGQFSEGVVAVSQKNKWVCIIITCSDHCASGTIDITPIAFCFNGSETVSKIFCIFKRKWNNCFAGLIYKSPSTPYSC